jgi:hypothetical protein|tara:strand:- start:222 stop:389 length:168 start_codon:yes stop_codon:yes gene_type:complete
MKNIWVGRMRTPHIKKQEKRALLQVKKMIKTEKKKSEDLDGVIKQVLKDVENGKD